MRWEAVAIVAILAGCVDVPAPTATVPVPSQVPPAEPILARDCTFVRSYIPVQRTWAEERVPEGFQPVKWLGRQELVMGYAAVATCVLNATGQAFHNGLVALEVSAPAKWSGARFNWLVLAEVNDQASMIERFRDWNATVHPGVAKIQSEPTPAGRSVHVVANLPGDDLDVRFLTRPPFMTNDNGPGGIRFFYLHDRQVTAAIHWHWGPHTTDPSNAEHGTWVSGGSHLGHPGPVPTKGFYETGFYATIRSALPNTES